MIVVATTERNGHPIPWYLESYGALMRDRLRPVHYEELLEDPDPIEATYCFADLELLTAAQLDRAARVHENLLARGCHVLNDPTRTLRRVDLLRALHGAGQNAFTVHREHESLDSCRFPVFVRCEHDHEGRRSELLHSADEVRQHLRGLRAAEPALGDLLVVEFCDTADTAGIYRKYSAFIVGKSIVARHVMFSRDWQVKQPDLRDQPLLEEERVYVATNPHEAELRAVFARAHVEYGRIDYSFRNGRMQVWEINTNPTILIPARVNQPPLSRVARGVRAVARPVVGRIPGVRRGGARRMHQRAELQPRAGVNRAFAERLATAWIEIDQPVLR